MQWSAPCGALYGGLPTVLTLSPPPFPSSISLFFGFFPFSFIRILTEHAEEDEFDLEAWQEAAGAKA